MARNRVRMTVVLVGLIWATCTPTQAADLSHYAYWAAVGGDVASSVGQKEVNPLLSRGGQAMNLGISSLVYGSSLYVQPHHGRRVRWIVAGVRLGVVVWNLKQRR